jgi:hypothetical protein
MQAISWLHTELLIARILLHRVLNDDNGGCSKKGVFLGPKRNIGGVEVQLH